MKARQTPNIRYPCIPKVSKWTGLGLGFHGLGLRYLGIWRGGLREPSKDKWTL